MTAIGNDAANDYEADFEGTDEFGAADEFLKGMLPADADRLSGSENDEDNETVTTKPAKTRKAPAVKPEAESDEEGEGEGSDEDDTDADEESEGEDEDGDDKAKDDEGGEEEPIFKIKVGDEVKEVKASELTRLWGQEASLTKKSMEVAELRRSAEADIERTTAATAALLERARLRAKPYANIDFNLAAQKLTEEEYTALRKEVQTANEEVQFLEHHTTAFMQAIKDQQQKELRTKAVETIKLLSGPTDKGGIEGWSDKVYNDIRSYAKDKGAPEEVINSIVDPWAIRMMHSAMMFERGKSKANVTITRVNKTPKKVVKNSASPAASRRDGKPDPAKAMARLARTGSSEDAADAFLASWGTDGDD